jgi:basic amino acid/polyamine antiporter, APA family
MADQVDVSGGAPAGQTAGGQGGSQFGLTAAMALIVGSITGVGIFNLPASLAFYGPITLISMVLTTVGALALALLFAALSRRLPADGGPYAYARVATPARAAGSTGRRSSWPPACCCSAFRSTWDSAAT